MNILKKIFSKRNKEDALLEEVSEILDEDVRINYKVNPKDPEMIKAYVLSFLEQMTEASKEVEELQTEYKTVDSYLHDLEEVEMIQGSDLEDLILHANGILSLEGDTSAYTQKKDRIKEADYRKMERFEDGCDEQIVKIKKTEEYQKLIKQDLSRLEGEKQACLYRQEEAKQGQANMRGMTVILIYTVFACIFMLLVMQFGFKMTVSVGYAIVLFATALILSILYFKYIEYVREWKVSTNSLNKVIILQNKVKIRYINNTNLLDYLYIKFEIPSGRDLERMYGKYMAEKEERLKYEEAEKDLEFHQEQLVRLLKRYRLHDPLIWLHQANAILDKKEMVEVRHSLITRRQKLRKQIEYNTNLGKEAQNEIKDIVKGNKAYAKEIMKMVEEAEKRL